MSRCCWADPIHSCTRMGMCTKVDCQIFSAGVITARDRVVATASKCASRCNCKASFVGDIFLPCHFMLISQAQVGLNAWMVLSLLWHRVCRCTMLTVFWSLRDHVFCWIHQECCWCCLHGSCRGHGSHKRTAHGECGSGLSTCYVSSLAKLDHALCKYAQ